MDISYSPKFIKKFLKLPEHIKDLVEEKEIIFKVNNFDSRLKTHKLHGTLNGYYAFSLNYKYRIIFSYFGDNRVRFDSIGTHDIYE